jgi:hypothetical protein
MVVVVKGQACEIPVAVGSECSVALAVTGTGHDLSGEAPDISE